jgi:hypothetical protein
LGQNPSLYVLSEKKSKSGIQTGQNKPGKLNDQDFPHFLPIFQEVQPDLSRTPRSFFDGAPAHN